MNSYQYLKNPLLYYKTKNAKQWTYMNENVAYKNRDNKSFTAVLYKQSFILRVKTILLT